MALVKKRNKNEVRGALYAWIAWAPLLALFYFMARDMSVSLQARQADYDFGKLAAKRRQVVADLDAARSKEANYTDIGRVFEIIEELKMLPPDPRQIQVVVVHPDTPMPVMRERSLDGGVEMADMPSAPAVALPVFASVPPAAPVMPAAAPASLAPVSPSAADAAPAVAVASRSAATATVLDLPKEQITDIDSPDAPTNDLLANL
jgi:hypothetical protein